MLATFPEPRKARSAKRNFAPMLSPIAFGILPVLVTALWVLLFVRSHSAGDDFRVFYWVTGWRVLHGLPPYGLMPGATIPNPYPAVGTLLLAPYSVLSRATAGTVFMGLNMLSVPLALWALGVRDWRVYGPALLWPPVVGGWHLGNVSLLIGLGIALLWRYRDNALIGGALVAVLISAKLFVWPLGLWLLATRRYASAVYAIGLGLVINLAAWAIVGFDQFPRFVHQLSVSSGIQERAAYTPFALALDLGAGRLAAGLVAAVLALGIGAATIYVGRRGKNRASLTFAVALSLLTTPIVWLHYLALLLIPFALARPVMSPIWALPFVMFTFPEVSPSSRELIIALLVSASLVITAARAPESCERAGSRVDPTRRGPEASVLAGARSEWKSPALRLRAPRAGTHHP